MIFFFFFKDFKGRRKLIKCYVFVWKQQERNLLKWGQFTASREMFSFTYYDKKLMPHLPICPLLDQCLVPSVGAENMCENKQGVLLVVALSKCRLVDAHRQSTTCLSVSAPALRFTTLEHGAPFFFLSFLKWQRAVYWFSLAAIILFNDLARQFKSSM